MSYRLATSCQHTQHAVWSGERHHLEGGFFHSERSPRHLISDADALMTIELTHSGKLDEAVVVKVVVDAQMVAVPEEEPQSLEEPPSLEQSGRKRKRKRTWRSSPTCPRRCHFFCWPRSHRGRPSLEDDLYTATRGRTGVQSSSAGVSALILAAAETPGRSHSGTVVSTVWSGSAVLLQ